MLGRREAQAIELMSRFAERTGVTGACPPRRYLWTDAFAVCNFLALSAATGEGTHTELALRLVEQVHRTLGRHRADDARGGWLSGLAAEEAEAHPTRGGLRIGKPLPERALGAPLDEGLEWERDGQYFHYLTKWMHALDQVSRATGQPMFNVWARELAETAHRAFACAPPGGGARRMIWKASMDLSRPLVGSMGQHDPLDGLLTCLELEATARAMGTLAEGPRLAAQAADFAAMVVPGALATTDPLGLGGLLVDAYRFAQLGGLGTVDMNEGLFEALLDAALAGLRRYVERTDLGLPADGRLGFRELGLAIGLAAADFLAEVARQGPEALGLGWEVAARLDRLQHYATTRTRIESFWLRPQHRRAASWFEHEDINDVMLATSLAPEGFLVMRRPGT